MNACFFSPDRHYRYLLIHKWNGLFPERACVWIGLNPSIADEAKLDNTLRRIRGFSAAAGFNSFYMANLFALVATDPKVMKVHPAPVGPENDEHIVRALKKVATVFVAWGTHGKHFDRDRQVRSLVQPPSSVSGCNQGGLSPASAISQTHLETDPVPDEKKVGQQLGERRSAGGKSPSGGNTRGARRRLNRPQSRVESGHCRTEPWVLNLVCNL